MKFFEIDEFAGKYTVKIFGKKVLSFACDLKYKKLYKNRFKGLTQAEEKYILETQFKRGFGYKLNLDNPQTFNEKMQWLKLYYREPLLTRCSDKALVRDYIRENVGEEYLVPSLGIYNNPDEIDFDKLPDKFVLKVNWGSGQNIIVKDKSKLNIEEAKEKLRNWMKPESNHYYNLLEWCYKDITPKIIIEEFIEEDVNKPVADYKFFCYNGEPKFMYVAVDSFNYKIMRINYYDCEFNKLPLIKHYPNTDYPLPKPKMWDKMLEVSRILSKPFLFVRVDFFIVGDELKVGELTFYPGGGMDAFEPMEWDYKFGEPLKLPINKENP